MGNQNRHELRMQKLKERKEKKQEENVNIEKKEKKESSKNILLIVLGVLVFALFIYNMTRTVLPYETEGDHALGPSNAPITIIAFGDFECPYTKQFADSVFDQLMSKYGGKIRFVYKDFPKDKHFYAPKAAEAAHCAGDQGRYWEYFGILFDNQGTFTMQNLKKYAAEIGLDSAQFNECLDSGKYKSKVESNQKEGSSAGVATTPTFFINGFKLDGAHPMSSFVTVVDDILANGS